MDGAESMRSGRSGRSERSHRSHHSHRHHHVSREPSQGQGDSRRHHRKHSSRHRNDGRHDNSRYPDENRSVSIKLPTSDDMQHLTKNDHVDVQILPQDDNWGDNTTAVTSETGWSEMDDIKMSTSEAMENSVGLTCSQGYAGAIFVGLLAVLAFLSPIAMVILPHLMADITSDTDCKTGCQGYVISLTFKLLILLIGTWALFLRRPKANMPRSFVFRVVVLMLLFVLSFAYWLFYTFRIIVDVSPDVDERVDYITVVLFSSSMVDSLIFVHYVAIVLVEIRQLQAQYTIKIIRSPDGMSKTYNIGQLSIQRAAVSCLEWYYRDFTVYNPYLDSAIHRKSNKASQSNMNAATKFKVYDVDGPLGGPSGDTVDQKSKAVFAAAARRRDSGHNERYYEEQEYERRVDKRKSRLITAAEESFTHIKRLRDDAGPAIPMDSKEAAEAIFPSMARSLQKFLRITRQQPAYPMEVIVDHLAKCVSYDMSPKAFLEEYLQPGTVINHPKQTSGPESWSLVSDTFLSRGIDNGTEFVIRKADISLMCVVKRIPYFNISEKIIDSSDHRFVLRLNSETSV